MVELSNLLKKPNKIEQFLNAYEKNCDVPVMLYGGGKGVDWFVKFMDKYSIPITCIIDKNKKTSNIKNIPLQLPEEVFEKYDKAIVVISALAYVDEIKEFITNTKPEYIVVSFDPTLEILQKKTYQDRQFYFLENEMAFNDLESVLADERSKSVLAKVIEGALTSDNTCYAGISEGTQYFPDIVRKHLTEDEVFVDVGAFTGDSSLEFINAVGNQYKKIYLFEPDSSNITVAMKNIKDERVEFIKKGVGNRNCELYFLNENDGTDEGAHVVEKNTESTCVIEIVKLDDMINDDVSYIKMDIEGMELDALEGAELLIRKYKPKMAISVYHKMEDLLEISSWIREMDMGYRLYLRHYWNCNGTDTILFAL